MRPSTVLTRVVQAAFTVLVLGVVVVLGQVPWGSSTGEAVLRLALRTVHGKVEVCRERSAEELATLPQHMRQEEVCDSYPVSYRLRVELDGRLLADETIEPGGLRRDRPHNVDREFTVDSGVSRLVVSFRPETPDAGIPGKEAPEVEAELAALPRYEMAREVRLAPDRVTLVYLDDASGSLDLVQD
ncbi:MAG: hypothetical protein R3244_03545 [Thermoanaerobaculia bacterium]|nr:hypothetical protein [Thermoanaerobaculia bacterium]